METKRTTESEQKVNPEQSKQVIPDEKINTPDDKSGGNASSGIGTILKGIWAYVLQNPGGTSGWAVAVVMFLTLITPKVIRVEVEVTSETISELVQDKKSEESLKLEKSLQKVEKNPKASVVDKAIFEAYRLQLAGKIEDAIEKWRSVANVVEGTNNDLAAGAWFAAGFLYMKETIGERKFSVFSIDRVSFPLKPYYQGNYQDRDAAEKAIFAYNEAIRLKPDFAEAHNNRGSIELVLGQYESARGNMELALKRYDSALAGYDEAIRLKPDFAEAYFNRGLVRISLNQHEEAIKDFDEAIRLNPSFMHAYFNRGLVRISLNQHEEAIKDFDEIIRLNPSYPDAYLSRGLAKSSLNQHEEALKDLDEAIKLNPDDVYAYLSRGLVRISLNQYEEAIKDFDEIIRLNPSYAEAYYNRGAASA